MAHAKRKTLKDGTARYYARYLGGDGRWHEEGGYATKREAVSVAHRREIEAQRGEWVSPAASKMTFKRFIDETYWPTAQRLELTTQAAYRSNLNKHFLPTFGHVPMGRITPGAVQAWVNEVTGTLSPRSIRKYVAFLNSVFELAVEHRVVAVNPCAHTRLPKVVLEAENIITPQEFDTLVAAVDTRYRTLVLLAIETGMRWGELIALRPCDFDFASNVITVRRTIVEISKKYSPTGDRYVLKTYPKSDKPRVIQIEPAMIRLIQGHMADEGTRDDALLFTSSNGNPLSRNNFRTRVWLPALAEAGLSARLTFHNLRSAHASWLLAGGADLQVVMERLGHTQITTTQKYLRSLPDSGPRALTALRKTRRRGRRSPAGRPGSPPRPAAGTGMSEPP